jgi:hypothetical protein
MRETPDRRSVFISFKTEEYPAADRLHRVLSAKGYNVWWQEKLQCGHIWHADIDDALQAAGCVIVLWSPRSMASEWVKHEASQAIARRVYAPARLSAMKIDSPFDRIQATDLIDWDGGDSHPGFRNLLRRVDELLPAKPTLAARAVELLKRNAFAIGLLAFAVAAVVLLLRIGASAEAQISAQHSALDQLQKAERSLTSIIANTEKLIEPELRFTYILGVGPQSSGHFTLENSGGGMAKIAAVRASIDGRPLPTDAGSLSAVGGPFGMVGHTLKVGETIGPGRGAKIFDIPARSLSGSQICRDDKERKRFFERLQLEVDYTSLLGALKTKKHEYKSTNPFDC